MKLKDLVGTVALAISAVLTILSYVVHFDQWLASIIKRPNVPLCVVWAWMLVITSVIVPLWRRSLHRAWEALIMAGVIFSMPLVIVTQNVHMGPSVSAAEYNTRLLAYTWLTAVVICAYALVADAFYLWLKSQHECSSAKR
jgi:hypothetical protein